MMKAILFTLIFLSTVVFAEAQKEHKHLPYEMSRSLLKSIDDTAMLLGKGKKIIYVFVDPLCPHSRKFMTMVSKNPAMLSKYQYHIFLYSIPRLKSTDVVSAVYMSNDPIGTLLQIMLEDKRYENQGNAMTQTKVQRIDTVAKEIDVYKRPYIFIVK